MTTPSLRTLTLACMAALAAGCTTLEQKMETVPLIGYDLVDMTKVDATRYQQDYAQCAVIANQDIMDVTRVANRAVGAAADRATLGVIGYRGAKDADRATVLKRCLSGRGYLVLR
jgi:hypothetical protein